MRGERSGDTEFTTVHVTQGLLRAQVVKAKLEGAGIPVLLEYESVGPVIGLTVDGLGQVQVRVPTPYADQARALIETETEAGMEEDG